MLQLDNTTFRYEPFPIGLIKPVMDDSLYSSLLKIFPPPDLFFHMTDDVGNKYSLSEKFNSRQYHAWIRRHPEWRDLHAYFKSSAFVTGILRMLRKANLDVGFRKYPNSLVQQAKKMLGDLAHGSAPRPLPNLEARFEFAMLPASGGCVTPHTDNPGKAITLVLSMVEPGTWNPAWGGGTDVNRMKDPSRSYDQLNKLHPGFAEVEVLRTYEFEPNQAVIFIKTFNSWHSVRPMTCPDPGIMRRTLTINIERID